MLREYKYLVTYAAVLIKAVLKQVLGGFSYVWTFPSERFI